ncbi:hydrolase [Glaciihabitans sp. INWT7]|uniref:glycosyl hydrolase family 18 protein n=1 Tax=Glaciihabitans sp. INWT7 TaxID=2596912 RepID=UPI001625B470|nr:glycosyl hydrolase family 18 protein [Glaciihabitans sp. INWT7]QNE46601.1 hydrolase [Glaciihabitans sp. INWT7]
MRSRIVFSLALATSLLLGGCAAIAAPPDSTPSPSATLPTMPTELYVVPDLANAASLDRDTHAITTIGIDGVTVSAAGNAVSKLPANAAGLVAAAHSRGLTADLLLSNYDTVTSDFSAKIASALLSSAENRSAVITQLVAQVTAAGFDGVQLDLESLGADDAAGLAAFTTQLHDSLGAPRSVSMAVMAESSPSRYRDAGYDFAQLTPQLARVVLMAYDQHGPSFSKPGPVGGLPWATTALDALIAAGVPTARIDLGIAGYGYSWPGNGSDGKQLSDDDSRALAGDLARWDSTQAEWTATLPDDTVVWWSDARSRDARHSLALSRNLHGLAVWELSLTDPL